jgi:mono/diheme cytochrome c family protein
MMFPRKYPPALLLALMGACGLHADEKVDFVREIQPILAEACVGCHGPEKQKGNLRLDTREALFKGGEDGQVIEPGNPEKSDLYRRLTLPQDDDDVMPPKGKTAHLTTAQIGKVRRWIAAGAEWPDGVVVAHGTKTKEKTVGPVPSPAELQAIAGLGKYGVRTRPVAAGVNWRRANFRSAGDSFPPEVFALLRQVTTMRELNLGGVRLKDEDLASIAGLKNLTVLHLDSTPITDTALEHLGALENLTGLNLFGTAITDAGLQRLAGLRNLKSLYVAETKVTAQGVARLQKDLPDVKIDTGAEIKDLAKKEPPAPAKTPEATKPQPKKEPTPEKK